MTTLNETFERLQATLLNEKTRLEEYCQKDPDVRAFVDLLLSGSRVGGELKMLCYQIGWSMDLRSVSLFSNLNSFIGNCFYDDSGWSIYRDSNVWEGTPETGDHGMKVDFCQDPKVLIAAAQENVAHYEKADKSTKIFLPFESSDPVLVRFLDNHISFLKEFREVKALEAKRAVLEAARDRLGKNHRWVENLEHRFSVHESFEEFRKKEVGR